ncbi:MAG: ROK family protein, partial [Lentisphaeria bacterium]|nr:ROK family protein [Lentisphaeria bacterium]
VRRAAAKLPRVDAIGGSAAGVYVDNQPRLASLFRGIPEADFPTKVRPVFLELAKEFPGVPFTVINDGEVTALAGALSMKRNALLGVAMGTSEAVGYVTPAGNLTDYLNDLAFAPVDYREEDAPRDEWSQDRGVGANYLSQQAVGRLAPAAGFEFAAGMPLPEQLKAVQAAMAAGDERAVRVYRSIGVYLGYAAAHYADFYRVENLLLLGRVSSGEGGGVIVDFARQVLEREFPELHIEFLLPDETFKRHGQAVIAATL